MKKCILIISLFFMGLSLSSCDLLGLENNQITYYGVAGYIDMGEDMVSPLSLNIPNLGWITVPNSDSISATVDGTLISDYEIQAGDLVRVWFSKVKDVEILESFPGQFAKEPKSITVLKHNVSLQQNENGAWIFGFDINEVAYDVNFNLPSKTVGDQIQIRYSTIVDDLPNEAVLVSTTIITLSNEKMSFEIPNENIDIFLKYFDDNNIIIYDIVPE